MGLNFFKKLFGNVEKVSEAANLKVTEKDIKEELKTILHDKWEEHRKATDIPFDELYSQMVEEAVLTIKENWRRRAKYNDCFNQPANEVLVDSLEVFFITEDRRLCSSNLYTPINPKTGHACFYFGFVFPNTDLIEQYIADIMERLPDGTIMEYTTKLDYKYGDGISYSFAIRLSKLLED